MKRAYGYNGAPIPELPEEEAEEYEDIGAPTCDECGTELEEMYEGFLVCEVCGKHFTERG